jgi:hypothetical protein
LCAVPFACLLLWRAREALVAIDTALIAVGAYRLLDLLGAVLVGGLETKRPDRVGGGPIKTKGPSRELGPSGKPAHP